MEGKDNLLRRGSPRSRRSREGQGLVEYSLILVLVAVVVILVFSATGTSIKEVYCEVLDGLDAEAPNACFVIPLTETGGPSIRKSEYHSDHGHLNLEAIMPEGCSGPLIAEGYGPMEKGRGDRYKLKPDIDPPPATVKMGSVSCGWTTVSVTIKK